MDLDHLTATNEDIINWCRSYELSSSAHSVDDRLVAEFSSNLVLRLNSHALVKFGPSVTASEAANQRLAHESLNGRFLRVPQVYRFFQDTSLPENHWRGRCGYLVMEFIQGIKLSELPLEDLPLHCHKIGRAIAEMSLLKSERPGPADGGEPHGYIWAPDYRAYEIFKTVDDVAAWFNRALVNEDTKIHFPSEQFPFCHLDLSRSNILYTQDESYALLDWADAGFYAMPIQIWCLKKRTDDSCFVESLLENLPELSVEEKATLHLLDRAYYWNSLKGL
ncbi:uncharacterized protein A1O9_13131 [Exophiala aquamarina CBS 119918]|uniref:Aminoglycoside phosphotransferase domain-containing protein n=1 Tax=Exophiala aquamarina CBS 119918 TaxID=1182545 RepID=A0A072NUX4_9EURO|nr:uncharacterized protein A1O9_13131 [Exophiala aquamarina CBS 119918]KEF50818.1 hypothetical protein A1O9_13131 [Exophiala aquamarina CBS 119918]